MKNLGFVAVMVLSGMLSLSYIGFNIEKSGANDLVQAGKSRIGNIEVIASPEETSVVEQETEALGTEAQGAFEETFPGDLMEEVTEVENGVEDPGVVTVEDSTDQSDPKSMELKARPGLDIVNLSLVSDRDQIITIEIFDQSGTRILSRNEAMKNGNNSFALNFSYVQSGVYLITASTEDWTNTKKVYKYSLS